MLPFLKTDDSKQIRAKIIEYARELIETNFSEYIPVLKDRTEMSLTDEQGNKWNITKTEPRCFKINVSGDVWCSTFVCDFEVTQWQLPQLKHVKLTTKGKPR